VLTLLQTGDLTIDIENILPEGFDYKGHLNNPTRTKWGDKELVGDIYHSFANEYFEKGEFVKALNNYEMAIKLNPQYEKAHLNKAILMDKLRTRR
jgi:Tfp pilus assembly protein PilF